MKAFVDTGGFAAVYYQHDPYHADAVQIWKALIADRWQLTTSNFVVNETLTLLRNRSGFSQAIEFGEAILSSVVVKVVRLSEFHERRAWEIFKKYADQDFSFTDCTSFALMHDLRIPSAFAFDQHFRIMGFEMLSPR